MNLKKEINKLKTLFLAFTLLIAFQVNLFGQTNKKVEKSVQLFNSGKIDKGISSMTKITEKDPTDSNWDMLVQMYYYRYEYAVEYDVKNRTSQLVAATIGNSEGTNMKDKNKSYTSPAVCFDELVSVCKKAGLYSQSLTASMYLRGFFVDYHPDTLISEEAKKAFHEAETFFGKKDYNNSKKHYQKALSIQPDYYKATIYLGDSYWYLNNMDSAIHYFQKGIEMCPDLLEPRKYLVDALGYSKQYEKAKKECIDAIFLYPDQSMFKKYADLVKKTGSVFNMQWVKRGCEINIIDRAEEKTNDALWKHYQNAKNEVNQYYNNNGIIIQPNEFTKARYLELYSWEKMLSSVTVLPEELQFAKKMADIGYLDCYVFISEFHFDLYAQYLDFVQNNKDKIKTYIETYLTE